MSANAEVIVKLAKEEPLLKVFDCTIKFDTITSLYADALDKFRSEYKMAGFRQGSVPVKIIEDKFGKQILANAIDKKVEEMNNNIISDHKIKLAGRPNIDTSKIESAAPGELRDVQFSIEYALFPSVPRVDFAKIKITEYQISITKEDVDIEMTNIIKSFSKVEQAEDGSVVKKGNGAVIDFVGKVDGKEFENGSANSYFLEVGSNTLIAGFEDQLVGHKAGDKFTVKTKFPADYHVPKLSNKDAEFDVTLHSIHTIVPPVVNEDFYWQNFNLSNEADVRSMIEDNIKKTFSAAFKARMRMPFFEKLKHNLKFEIDSKVVKMEEEKLLELKSSLEKEGALGEAERQSVAKKLKDIRQEAEARVRLGYMIALIVESNKIDVSDDAIKSMIQAEAKKIGISAEEILKEYNNNPELKIRMKGLMEEEAAFNLIYSRLQKEPKVIDKKDMLALSKQTEEQLQSLIDMSLLNI